MKNSRTFINVLRWRLFFQRLAYEILSKPNVMEPAILFQIALVVALLLLSWLLGKHFAGEATAPPSITVNPNMSEPTVPRIGPVQVPSVSVNPPLVFPTQLSTGSTRAPSIPGTPVNRSTPPPFQGPVSVLPEVVVTPPSWPSIREWDFPGNDIERFGNSTRASCQAACQNENSCMAAAFDERIQACFLKSSLSAKNATFPGDRVTFLKPQQTSRLARYPGKDISDRARQNLFLLNRSTRLFKSESALTYTCRILEHTMAGWSKQPTVRMAVSSKHLSQ